MMMMIIVVVVGGVGVLVFDSITVLILATCIIALSFFVIVIRIDAGVSFAPDALVVISVPVFCDLNGLFTRQSQLVLRAFIGFPCLPKFLWMIRSIKQCAWLSRSMLHVVLLC